MPMRTRITALAITLGLVTAPLVGCGGTSSTSQGSQAASTATAGATGASVSSNSATSIFTTGELSLSYPESWPTKDAEKGIYVYPTFGGMIHIVETDNLTPVNSEIETIKEFIDGMESTDRADAVISIDRLNGIVATSGKKDNSIYTFPLNILIGDTNLKGSICLICDWPHLYQIVTTIPEDIYDKYNKDVSEVLSSIELSGENIAATTKTKERISVEGASQEGQVAQDAPKDSSTQEATKEEAASSNAKPEQAQPEQPAAPEEVSPEFRATMDSYEAFFDEYVDFMRRYKENPTDMEILGELGDMLSREADMIREFDRIKDEDLNAADMAYYLEVHARIYKKLAEVL